MKRLRACVLAVAIGLAAPSFATPAVAQQASASETAAKEALVRRYFAVAQLEKITNGMLEAMIEPMLAQSRIPEDKHDLFRQTMQETFAAVMPQMMEAYVVQYTEAFTLEELQQLVAFYESPVGQSIMTKTVLLSREAGAMMERFQPIMHREMMTRLCARIDCGASATGAANK